MILVDTSVWIDHFRSGVDALANALESDKVMTHPSVVGELACGHLHNRAEVLRLLDELPQAPVGNELAVRVFIERHRLMGRGIGYIDAHLLAAATLAAGGVLWTRDKRLASVAAELHVGANEWTNVNANDKVADVRASLRSPSSSEPGAAGAHRPSRP